MRETPIILTTINARYFHAALGLRRLRANMGDLRERTAIHEFQLGTPPLTIAETLLEHNPRIVGCGVAIWNLAETTEVVQALKAVRPEVVVVLGGPEVRHEYENLELFKAADYLIRGEADRAFGELAAAILAGRAPREKVLTPDPPDLDALAPPYDEYTDADIAHRKLYVEASRGCPLRCDFCLSALDDQVRNFPLERFLPDMERLIERGARAFIFVDRTFNLDQARMLAVLDFFLQRWRPGMHLHLEILPDRLTEPMLASLARFPEGGLHLETGLQTLNPNVQALISRGQDIDRTMENLRALRARTHAWLHADLIVGLPGESWESFAAGFDRLIALRPQQVQVGVLKRLRGAPIARHSKAFGLVFASRPPYEILQTSLIDFARMQRLKRFARFFDLFYNSGNFTESLEMLWARGASAFERFVALSDAIWSRARRTHEIPLAKLARHLHDFMADAGIGDRRTVRETIERDYRRVPGRREKLDF